MREIKFRAWLPSMKRMTYTHTIDELMNWNTKVEDNGTAIWLQYTGLKDGKHADDKEIYQGDICKDDKGSIVVIEWNDENFCFSCRIIKGGALTEGLRFPLWQYKDCQMNGYRYLEVIGNIYENPDLLTQPTTDN